MTTDTERPNAADYANKAERDAAYWREEIARLAEFVPHNAEDWDDTFWDPWEALGLNYAGYNSEVDQDAINVLAGIGDGLFCDQIALKHTMQPSHVELLQYLFCSAGWCEYGTSPRCCWPMHGKPFAEIVASWRAYYWLKWESPRHD